MDLLVGREFTLDKDNTLRAFLPDGTECTVVNGTWKVTDYDNNERGTYYTIEPAGQHCTVDPMEMLRLLDPKEYEAIRQHEAEMDAWEEEKAAEEEEEAKERMREEAEDAYHDRITMQGRLQPPSY